MKRSFWGNKNSPGPESRPATVRIADLMVEEVVALTRHQSVGHARDLMERLAIHSLPIVDASGAPLGILTSNDLIQGTKDETLVGNVMTRNVHTVSQYESPHIAARIMRKHRIHHLIVTHEQRVIGVISSFDLLRLIEDKRFVYKNLPSKPKKATWESKKKKKKRTGTP